MMQLVFNGDAQTLTQWSKKTGIPRQILAGRVKLGWDAEKILTTPAYETWGKKSRIFLKTEVADIIYKYSAIHESPYVIAKFYGCSPGVIYRLLKSNNIDTNIWGRRYFFNEDYFEEIDTPTKAYWLGLFYADGCVNDHTFILGLKESDRHLLEELATCVKYNGDLAKISVERSFNGNDPKTYSMFRLNLCSKKFCDHLRNKGLTPNKTSRVQYPNIRKDLNSHFIRGVFDGDGSVSNTGKGFRWSIVGQKDFLLNISNIIKVETDVVFRCYKSKENLWQMAKLLQYSQSGINRSNTVVQDLFTLRNWLYKDAEVSLNRKRVIFDSLQPLKEFSGISIKEAATILQVSCYAIRKKIKTGEIESYKEGMYRRIKL